MVYFKATTDTKWDNTDYTEWLLASTAYSQLVNIDALLQRTGITQTTSLDAYLMKTIPVNVSIDALLKSLGMFGNGWMGSILMIIFLM